MKPVAANQWTEDAELGFWAEYGRRRATSTKARFALDQIRALEPDHLAVVARIADRLVVDVAEDPEWLAPALIAQSGVALETGEQEVALQLAIDAAVAENRRMIIGSLANPPASARMVDVFLVTGQHAYSGRVLATLDSLDAANAGERPPRRAERDLLRAAVLSVTDPAVAASIATPAFSILSDEGQGLLSRLAISGSRVRDRALFSVASQGGKPRLLALLDDETKLTPSNIRVLLSRSAYFRDVQFTESQDRLIVDLAEFSLDFRFFDDAEAIDSVRWSYDRFPFEDRRHIPEPPEQPTRALVVLTIGEELSIPDVVNPMIDLTAELDVGECIFLHLVGSLSPRADLAEVDTVDARHVERRVTSRLQPLLVGAGFTRLTARRFEMDAGGLGHYASVQFRLEQDASVELYFRVCYRGTLSQSVLERHTDESGQFRPPGRLTRYGEFISAGRRWQPERPTETCVEAMVDDIGDHLRTQVLPVVARTADPIVELRRRSVELTDHDHRPLDRHMLGVCATMAALLGDDDVEASLRAAMAR